MEDARRTMALAAADKFIDGIQELADVNGPYHSPLFRYCLGDNRKWVAPLLAELIFVATGGEQAR